MVRSGAKFCSRCGAMLDEGRPRCPECNAAVRPGRGILALFSSLLALLRRSPIRFNVELRRDDGHLGADRLFPVDGQLHRSTRCGVDRIELRRPDGTVQKFGSLDEVPDEIRRLLQGHLDQVGAGTTMLKGSTSSLSTTVNIVDENGVRSEEYTLTGDDGVKRTYRSLDEMPAHVRVLFDRDRDGRRDPPCIGD